MACIASHRGMSALRTGFGRLAPVFLVCCSAAPAARDGAVDAPAVTADAPAVTADAGVTERVYRAGPWVMPVDGERSNDCESWTLHNEEPIYLNAVEMEASPGMHHSNWFFVPDTQYPGPDGTWPCRERNFDQGIASYLGGVFFAQTTQIRRETQQFPPGTAVVIPPHARIIGALHQRNVTPEPISVSLTLRARTIPREAVRTRLSPFYLEYNPLEIAPRSRSRFEVECPLDERARMLTGAPLSMRFFYGLAHYHELGAGMRVDVLGGVADGRVLYDSEALSGDSWATTMEPAVDVSGARSIRLTCTFDNPRNQTVRYGIGDQEMCIWFGFTDSPWQWAGRAPRAASSMVRRETRDGVSHSVAPCTELYTLLGRYNGQ